MTTKGILLSTVLAAIIIAVVFYWSSFVDFSYELNEFKSIADQILIKEVTEIKDEIEKGIYTPPPLRAEKESYNSFLTQEGVLGQTNSHRAENNLKPLVINNQLSHAASLKINNMLQGQYFGHISPEGLGPDYWIENAGYEYILIGENLALGNFENDKELVQAWMDSPGHRANILNDKYTEIGIAVSSGIFEGKETWLAVQTFGLPLSVCPEPDASLKNQLESMSLQLEALKSRIDELKQNIEQSDRKSPEYNQMISEYNVLVAQYNSIVAGFKNRVAEYNNQVAVFNQCVSK